MLKMVTKKAGYILLSVIVMVGFAFFLLVGLCLQKEFVVLIFGPMDVDLMLQRLNDISSIIIKPFPIIQFVLGVVVLAIISALVYLPAAVLGGYCIRIFDEKL